jgi:hypothetical protein
MEICPTLFRPQLLQFERKSPFPLSFRFLSTPIETIATTPKDCLRLGYKRMKKIQKNKKKERCGCPHFLSTRKPFPVLESELEDFSWWFFCPC